MKQLVLVIYIFCSFSYFVYSQTAHIDQNPQIIYISTTGEDSPDIDGSEESPFVTITYALSRADKNNYTSLIINVEPGTYDQAVTVNLSGSQTFPIKIQANDNSNKPVFLGNDTSVFDSTKDAIFRWTDKYDYITLDGIIIQDATANINLRGFWINGDNCVIRNCEVHTIVRTGIIVQGNYNLIENNIVDNIIGDPSNPTINGNNISVESYYQDNNGIITRRNSEFNIIQYNHCSNNPTHFGINIFPYTADDAQPIMHGNKIYFNYIDSTGGGIYTRFQKDLEISNNVIVKNYVNTLWSVQGGGIFFDKKDTSVQIDSANIKIYNNTIADNDGFGIENNTSNNIYIKNNIISNCGGWYIKFQDFAADNTSHIDYNLYYNSTRAADWMWDSAERSFSQWQRDSGGDSSAIINQDPLFNGPDDYELQYGSPAKNGGVGLKDEGIIVDYFGNQRPYWNKDYDIGAYEITEDAQLKIGLAVQPSQPVYFKLTSAGTYWERNSSGSFVTSQQSSNSTTVCKVSLADTNQNAWSGWKFGWINNSVSDSINTFALGLYKLESSSDTTKYFFIDYRDAIGSYSPNIYIRFNNSSSPNRFEYLSGSTWNPIAPGDVLRIWNMNNNGVSNTIGLSDYWDNTLVCVNKGNYPYLIFGPYTDPNNISYYEIQKINDISAGNTWEYLDKVGPELAYLDNTDSLGLQDTSRSVAYKIVAHLANPPQLISSDSVVVKLNEYYVLNVSSNNNFKQPEYFLNQNYPNPFNPDTKIQYSIKNAGLVKIELFDILGRRVRTIVNEVKPSGEYEVAFNGHNLASGVYIYRLIAGTFVESKRMVLLK